MAAFNMEPNRVTEREPTAALQNLFARSTCVKCPDSTPACPECPSGQSCQVTVPLTCSECPRSYCAANAATPSASPKSTGHTNTAAITGGSVAAGVVVIAAVTYLVWRFCIKSKRRHMPTKAEEDGEAGRSMDGDPTFAARRAQRASTHTVHSIASTVLTRASNIIQIAYIPGVVNRATPTSPNVLVPPVPPIPIAISGSNASTPAGTEDQHFFVPGDLRDSTYSGFSGFSDRTSFARTSYAPRSSIASTIYGKNAVIVAPPQTGMRIKPTMVNLKSPSNLGPGIPMTPPVPNVDYEKYNGTGVGNNSSSNLRPVSVANSTFSVGSTFLNNASAHTAMPARPVVVRVGNGPKKPSSTGSSSPSPLSETDNAAGSPTLVSPAREKYPSPLSSPGHESTTYTIIEDSPSPDQGPFSDPPASPNRRNENSLSAVIEEATRRASQKDLVESKPTDRNQSPFGDENATHDI